MGPLNITRPTGANNFILYDESFDEIDEKAQTHIKDDMKQTRKIVDVPLTLQRASTNLRHSAGHGKNPGKESEAGMDTAKDSLDNLSKTVSNKLY